MQFKKYTSSHKSNLYALRGYYRILFQPNELDEDT